MPGKPAPARAAAILLAVAFAASAPAEDAEPPSVVPGNSAFAFDLFARLRLEPGNLFVSPYSISTALAMTYAGARGETAAEMARVMHFDLPQEKLHPAMGALIRALNERTIQAQWKSDPDAGKKPYEMVVANALWGQQGYPFEPAFLDGVQAHYGGGFQPLDFRADPEVARRAINAWVAKKTADKIRELLAAGQVTSDARLVLTNAIYFKSAWDEPFQERATQPAPFHLGRDRSQDVPTMHRSGHLGFVEEPSFWAVELPYQRGELAMIFLVPKDADGLPSLEQGLTADRVQATIASLKPEWVALALPRFKFSARFVLNDALQALGMKQAFGFPAADFSGISPTRELFIGFVIHQAYVDVHEQGTEAAAATAVGMRAGGVPPPPKPVKIDRPFLFLIRDQASGSILFLGRVADPGGDGRSH